MPIIEKYKYFLRSYILMCYESNISASECFNKVKLNYGADVVSKGMVFYWYKRFESGNLTVLDLPKVYPKRKFQDEELDNIITQDPGISAIKIANKLNVSKTTVYKRLKEMNIKHRPSKMVPYNIQPKHYQSRIDIAKENLANFKLIISRLITSDEKWVKYDNTKRKYYWCHKDEDPPTQGGDDLYPKKVMVTIFWDMHGVLLIDYLPKNKTVKHPDYIRLLRELKKAVKEKRPNIDINNKLYLLDDNASPHKHELVWEALKELNIERIKHPSYSPDLSPSDYFLFKSMGNYLNNQTYKNEIEVKDAINYFFNSTSNAFFYNGIHQLQERYQTVIENNGDYITDNHIKSYKYR